MTGNTSVGGGIRDIGDEFEGMDNVSTRSHLRSKAQVSVIY